jgi:phenylacetate-CoA ligase
MEIRKDEYWNPKMETMPLKELKELQLQKIKYIVNYAYAMSPFYRRRFDEAKVKPEDIKTFDDFRKRIPIFRKDEVRAEIEKTGDLFWGNKTVPLDAIFQICPSTGTTGTPTPQYGSREDLDLISENIARIMWGAKLRPSSRLLLPCFIWHRDVPYYASGIRKISPKTSILAGIPAVLTTDLQIEAIKRLKCDYFVATLDQALDINEKCRVKGVIPKGEFPSARYLLTGHGEAVTPGTREMLIDLWGLEDCFDMGGFGDPLFDFIDCFAHDGSHIAGDMGYIELIDPDTNELLEPGERGEFTITTFCKAQPFIRYAHEDYGELIEETCSCGRTHPRVKVYTRTGWLVKVAGKTVDPYRLRVMLEEFPETSEANFSIIREAKEMDKLKFQVVYDAKITKDPEELKNRIKEAIKKEMGVDAEITWVTWEELPKILHKIRRVVDV